MAVFEHGENMANVYYKHMRVSTPSDTCQCVILISLSCSLLAKISELTV